MISPWKSGWLNPSTISCTGPIAMSAPFVVSVGRPMMAESERAAHHPVGVMPRPSPPGCTGPMPDPLVLLRSRSYVQLLVVAGLIGIPVSALAYGFLKLVD